MPSTMMMRSPERRTAVLVETPLPGSIKGTVQKNKSELINQRAPFRRTIKLLHEKLMESINRESPHTFLKRKMLECELVWEQCRNIDRILLEIMEEQNEEKCACIDPTNNFSRKTVQDLSLEEI